MSRTKTINKEIDKSLSKLNDSAAIVVFNDEENTFEWVIESFVDICGLNLDDAVSKTLYIHFNGQNIVCEGEYEDMKNKKDKLIDRTIKAIVSRPNLN